MSDKSRLLSVIVFLAIPCLGGAQIPAGPGPGVRPDMISGVTPGTQLFSGIQLTSEQRARVLSMTKAWSKDANVLLGNRMLIRAGPTVADQAQERQVQDLFVVMVRPILTPEQRAIFDRNVNGLRRRAR